MPCDSQQVYNRICVVREQLSQAASNWDCRHGTADKTINIDLPAKFAELQIKYKDLESKNADLTEELDQSQDELSQSQDGLNRWHDNLKRPSVSSKNKSSIMSLIFRTCQ
jgi:septal ring factor EnvC (AmiA/AmiB activator)